ncbi:hypothetical protein [Shinella zoogloeoides]
MYQSFMSEKPPLSDAEVYDLLHRLWLHAAAEKGATEFGENTLKTVRVSLFALQAAMVMKSEGLTGQMPFEPSPHSD